LRELSKIATVAELSASFAHQLNQPLMAVLGNAQAAKRWVGSQSARSNRNKRID
jgi:C4-dicarboxylate-specific signal transduction histidine kinase